jgi:predicted ATPase
MAASTGQELLERDAELTRIDALIAAAVGGSGAVAVVDAAAGLGKTALLKAATRARACGL